MILKTDNFEAFKTKARADPEHISSENERNQFVMNSFLYVEHSDCWLELLNTTLAQSELEVSEDQVSEIHTHIYFVSCSFLRLLCSLHVNFVHI